MKLTVDFTGLPADIRLRTFNDPPTTDDWLLVWTPNKGSEDDIVTIAFGSLYEILGLGETIIEVAQRAIAAHEPQEAMSPTPISQGDVVQYAQRQYIVAEVQADLLVLDDMADGDPATCRERCTVLAEDVQIVGTQFRMEDVDAKR